MLCFSCVGQKLLAAGVLSIVLAWMVSLSRVVDERVRGGWVFRGRGGVRG